MNLDRTLRFAQTYVDKAQRELVQTRSLSSQYNQRMRDLQRIIQRRNDSAFSRQFCLFPNSGFI